MPPIFAAHLTREHGLVTAAQALALGVSPTVLRNMVRRNELVRIHRGVYRHVAAPVTLEQRLRAGLLAIGDGGVVSHRAALARHRVRTFECDLVELTHRSLSMPLREGIVVHRSRTLGPADVTRVGGLWTTTVARSLVDTAALLPPTLVGRYASELVAHRRTTLDEIAAAVRRAGNHRGARALLGAMEDLDPEADTVAEARLGSILRDAGMPPQLHVLVTTVMGSTFELDWSYPRHRLGLELDGYGVHLRSVQAFDDDRDRRNELEISGWTILNFTARHIRRRPDRVVDQVRRALAVSVSGSL